MRAHLPNQQVPFASTLSAQQVLRQTRKAFVKSRAGRNSIRGRKLTAAIEAEIAALIDCLPHDVELRVECCWENVGDECQIETEAEIEIWSAAENLDLLSDRLGEINEIIRKRDIYFLMLEHEVERFVQDGYGSSFSEALEECLEEFEIDQVYRNISISLEVLV